MPLARPRPFSFRRAFAPAVALALLPLTSAFAQQAEKPYPWVRVTKDGTEISSLRQEKVLRMKAPQGTLLEVMYIDGDRYQHRDSNWYWVLLPLDPHGTRPAGWIRGDAIEHTAPPAPAVTPRASREDAPPPPPPRNPAREAVTSAPVSVEGSASARATEAVAVSRPFVVDVVLNFEFDKSSLTDEAKRKLASAVSIPKPNTRIAVALEGYADWIGPEGYNERLGLARAETVRQYLAELLRVPADQISVISYGESNPVASNATKAGRAQNRRVVIKGGA
jgi:outer membrane protein OmpA-like peptidoglycan-associated protein